jgi:hypothetical protein
MNALVGYTEQIRELDTLTPVERDFPTREETIAYLTRLYDEQLPQQEWDRLTAFYHALGLLPAETDLRQVYLDLLGSQVAGFYDTDTQIMNVIPLDENGGTLGISEQIIFVHEYTHALQDQHFDLDALSDRIAADDTDGALALVALIEGDATAVMNVYTQGVTAQNPLAALALLSESLQAGNLTLPPGIPTILLRELLFPYDGGFVFISALFREGGWDAIDAAYANPPTTTEQILHPDKYLAGEGAQTDLIAPSEIADMLSGWEVLYHDAALGEFYLIQHLRTELSSTQAEQAAAGWGGDAFTLLQDPATGGLAWRWSIQWDSIQDAAEFSIAYVDLLTARGDQPLGDGCFTGDFGALCIDDGTQVTTITSAPTVEIVNTLRAGE